MKRADQVATTLLLITVLAAAHAAGLGSNPQRPSSGVAAPEITNPAIKAILSQRSSRVPALYRYKTAAVIGENRQGQLEVRSPESLAPRERTEVQKMVRAENADRERMFGEIAAATGVDLSQLPSIRSRYAKAIRRIARSGDWIQMPDGKWRKKG